MKITEFLLARIAVDEAVARAATGTRWHGQACEVRTIPQDETGATEPYWSEVAKMHHPNHFQDARHIARHDPARVLAECAAKRAIVADYLHQCRVRAEMDRRNTNPAIYYGQPSDRVICQLAAVYADHPDYDEEWRP